MDSVVTFLWAIQIKNVTNTVEIILMFVHIFGRQPLDSEWRPIEFMSYCNVIEERSVFLPYFIFLIDCLVLESIIEFCWCYCCQKKWNDQNKKQWRGMKVDEEIYLKKNYESKLEGKGRTNGQEKDDAFLLIKNLILKGILYLLPFIEPS